MKTKQIMVIVAGIALATVMAEAKGGKGTQSKSQNCKQECAQECTQDRKQDCTQERKQDCTKDGAQACTQKKSGPQDMTGPKSRDGSCDRM